MRIVGAGGFRRRRARVSRAVDESLMHETSALARRLQTYLGMPSIERSLRPRPNPDPRAMKASSRLLRVPSMSTERAPAASEQGDQQATNPDALCRDYLAVVRRLVRRSLGEDADADDIVQKAMMRIIARAHTVRDLSALGGWVRCLTLNVIRTETRARANQAATLAASEQVDRCASTTTSEVECPHLQEAIETVLHRLPADERTALTMRCIEERTLSDVAARCGWSLATTKRRIAKSTDNFRKIAGRQPAIREYFDECGLTLEPLSSSAIAP